MESLFGEYWEGMGGKKIWKRREKERERGPERQRKEQGWEERMQGAASSEEQAEGERKRES